MAKSGSSGGGKSSGSAGSKSAGSGSYSGGGKMGSSSSQSGGVGSGTGNRGPTGPNGESRSSPGSSSSYGGGGGSKSAGSSGAKSAGSGSYSGGGKMGSASSQSGGVGKSSVGAGEGKGSSGSGTSTGFGGGGGGNSAATSRISGGTAGSNASNYGKSTGGSGNGGGNGSQSYNSGVNGSRFGGASTQVPGSGVGPQRASTNGKGVSAASLAAASGSLAADREQATRQIGTQPSRAVSTTAPVQSVFAKDQSRLPGNRTVPSIGPFGGYVPSQPVDPAYSPPARPLANQPAYNGPVYGAQPVRQSLSQVVSGDPSTLRGPRAGTAAPSSAMPGKAPGQDDAIGNRLSSTELAYSNMARAPRETTPFAMSRTASAARAVAAEPGPNFGPQMPSGVSASNQTRVTAKDQSRVPTSARESIPIDPGIRAYAEKALDLRSPMLNPPDPADETAVRSAVNPTGAPLSSVAGAGSAAAPNTNASPSLLGDPGGWLEANTGINVGNAVKTLSDVQKAVANPFTRIAADLAAGNVGTRANANPRFSRFPEDSRGSNDIRTEVVNNSPVPEPTPDAPAPAQSTLADIQGIMPWDMSTYLTLANVYQQSGVTYTPAQFISDFYGPNRRFSNPSMNILPPGTSAEKWREAYQAAQGKYPQRTAA